MTEQPLDPPVVDDAWLPAADVLGWLQLEAGSPNAGKAELARKAAAAYCADQRRDLIDDAGVFHAGPGIIMAGVLAAARLYARAGSPAGLASYGEFGPASVLRLDPDVARHLGTGRHATPRVG